MVGRLGLLDRKRQWMGGPQIAKRSTFCSVGRTPIFGLFGPVSVALSCCWFSKLSNGMLAAKNNEMGWQPLSKDKLVTASKKADLHLVRYRLPCLAVGFRNYRTECSPQKTTEWGGNP